MVTIKQKWARKRNLLLGRLIGVEHILKNVDIALFPYPIKGYIDKDLDDASETVESIIKQVRRVNKYPF